MEFFLPGHVSFCKAPSNHVPPWGGGKLEKIEIWQILQGQSKHCIVLLFTTLQLFLCFENYYCHWILDKLA